MPRFIDEAIDQYAFESTRPEPPELEDLAARTRVEMEHAGMLTGRVEGRLLKLLVQIHGPQLVLEVGTFTGYSALSMAEGLPPGGRLVTCEVDPAARDMAQAAFDASPHGERIELCFGPALETIRALAEPVDFAFIDADKELYPDYYEEIVQRTRSGGLILLDNMLMSGRVLDPREQGPRAIARLNAIIAADERVENVLLTVRDGVQLVRVR